MLLLKDTLVGSNLLPSYRAVCLTATGAGTKRKTRRKKKIIQIKKEEECWWGPQLLTDPPPGSCSVPMGVRLRLVGEGGK